MTSSSSTNIDLKFLKQAVNQAKKSLKLGGFPAGTVLVKDGKVISLGVSLGFKLHDPTSHSDTSSIRIACQKLKTTNLTGATIYTTLQPCLMCFSVAGWANIKKIIYGCQKTSDLVQKGYYEGSADINKINDQNNQKIELMYIPDYESEILSIISEWEKINIATPNP
ncbi:MAG: nucleoside deaminase [Candidatus Shapirobacteria bacterium]|jgi:tRNA(adenine34) deaminase